MYRSKLGCLSLIYRERVRERKREGEREKEGESEKEGERERKERDVEYGY